MVQIRIDTKGAADLRSGRSPDTIDVRVDTCCTVLEGLVDEALKEEPKA